MDTPVDFRSLFDRWASSPLDFVLEATFKSSRNEWRPWVPRYNSPLPEPAQQRDRAVPELRRKGRRSARNCESHWQEVAELISPRKLD